jgi:hypothetical protein
MRVRRLSLSLHVRRAVESGYVSMYSIYSIKQYVSSLGFDQIFTVEGLWA